MNEAIGTDWLAERLPSPTAKDLAADLGQLIKHGEIPPGARLPPVRDLAAVLGVSPATVSSAWQRLRARDVLVGGGRSGMQVAGAPTTPRPVRYQSEGDFGSGLRFDLKLSAPDPALLPDPMAVLATLPRPADLNDYTRTRIVETLDRAARAEWPYPARSLMTANGGYEALMITLNTFIQPGDIVLVEDPSTARMLDIIDLTGARTVHLERDAEGILPSALRSALSARPTALVLQPSLHNALGVAMTAGRRDALAAVLAGTEMLIIEDDGFGPLVDGPIHTLSATAPEQSVYIRSYSKSHGPDLRLAILEGPAAVIDRISDYRQYGSAWSSRILQECLAAMLTSSEIRRGVQRAAATYDRRRAALESALRARGLDVPTVRGMNIWLPVVNERFAMVTLAAHGIAVMSGSRFGATAATDHIRISASTLRDAQTAEVADALTRAVAGPGKR
ncbi:aminotransferase-like domain-containing protein [Microlunatus soli]|uniref:DNA-binding transcriptional regulator, MocR family, contains an aminotransferase domain n=1 Tax=Microlunatus soli TaxID=630515 RepID=A0A1H1ZYS4_9ACTN|nr:PLP-dependent aminotransferase family protein [Microlunatus soli]SDT38396.1 DNA-binding transcriptional regulator, MocR family, contains an aminotransferase domain [Microlunatus soli]